MALVFVEFVNVILDGKSFLIVLVQKVVKMIVTIMVFVSRACAFPDFLVIIVTTLHSALLKIVLIACLSQIVGGVVQQDTVKTHSNPGIVFRMICSGIPKTSHFLLHAQNQELLIAL